MKVFITQSGFMQGDEFKNLLQHVPGHFIQYADLLWSSFAPTQNYVLEVPHTNIINYLINVTKLS